MERCDRHTQDAPGVGWSVRLASTPCCHVRAVSEAQDLPASAREAAAAVGAHIVPATLETGDGLAIAHVALLEDEFAALVMATRPPAPRRLSAALKLVAASVSLGRSGAPAQGRAVNRLSRDEASGSDATGLKTE